MNTRLVKIVKDQVGIPQEFDYDILCCMSKCFRRINCKIDLVVLYYEAKLAYLIQNAIYFSKII